MVLTRSMCKILSHSSQHDPAPTMAPMAAPTPPVAGEGTQEHLETDKNGACASRKRRRRHPSHASSWPGHKSHDGSQNSFNPISGQVRRHDPEVRRRKVRRRSGRLVVDTAVQEQQPRPPLLYWHLSMAYSTREMVEMEEMEVARRVAAVEQHAITKAPVDPPPCIVNFYNS